MTIDPNPRLKRPRSRELAIFTVRLPAAMRNPDGTVTAWWELYDDQAGHRWIRGQSTGITFGAAIEKAAMDAADLYLNPKGGRP